MKTYKNTAEVAAQSNLDPADRALIQSYIEKYINTGVKPSEKDKIKMLELTKKYNVKVNSNPRPIISRFTRVRENITDSNRNSIPHEAPENRSVSRMAVKKQRARDRKALNRAAHS